MPRNPPSNGRWKPGQSGNPRGGQIHNPEVKKLRRISKDEVAEIGGIIIGKNIEELTAVVNTSNPKSPTYDPKKYTVLQIWFASIAIKAINKGDPYALNAMLDRIIGKVQTEVKLSGSLDIPNLTPEQAAERFKKLKGRIHGRGNS